MGSMINLAVGRLEIDWGKNWAFVDHSPLFQNLADVAQVPYYYAGDSIGSDFEGDPEFETIVEYKEGLSKPLNEVADRLQLLGYTYSQCEKEFSYIAEINRFDETHFRFEDLRFALKSVDVSAISTYYGEGGEDFGKFFRREIAPRIGLQEYFRINPINSFAVSEGMENLSPYIILQLLSQNPSAKNLHVKWAFSDVEEEGYANRNDLVRPLDPTKRFLIVTEGSSDAAVLKHALRIRRPHIEDFFHFVDMEEGYPFTGTGNLLKFVTGLISISVQNDVLVLLDNDAAGLETYQRFDQRNVPCNIRILKLPDLDDFKEFPTIGPTGQIHANINGRAAAIECYLDLDEDAVVRWTNYNRNLNVYHGELDNKEKYMKYFFDAEANDENYNYRRIDRVLDRLIENAIAIREAELEKRWTRTI
jgi:hypothetical protein